MMGINYQLINKLNHDQKLHWRIAYNDEVVPSGSIRKIFANIRKTLKDNDFMAALLEYIHEHGHGNTDQSAKLHELVPEDAIVVGISLGEVLKRAVSTASKSSINLTPTLELKVAKSLASYHHAFALDRAISAAQTRFLVLIDPDFYVVQTNWISRVLSHMRDKELVVFGAPWNPSWYQKFRNFPCTHLMVIDRQRLPLHEGAIIPDLISPGPKFKSDFWSNRSKEWSESRVLISRDLLRHPWRALKEDWAQRRTIGTSQDTGFAIRKICEEQELAFDALTPVFDPSVEGFTPPSVSPLQVNSLVQYLLPEDKVYVPKRIKSFSTEGFRERGFPDFRGLGWEEFLWRDEPFAFHMRGEKCRTSAKDGKFLTVDFDHLSTGLDTILDQYHLGTLAGPLSHREETTALIESSSQSRKTDQKKSGTSSHRLGFGVRAARFLGRQKPT